MAAVYALVMLGGALPIPLWAYWAPDFGFGPFTTTAIFAVYAAGVVLALVVFAALSDQAGRRPLLASAVLATAVSSVVFLLATGVGALMAARFLSGLAAGVVTATASAALAELAGEDRARQASAVATGASLGGLGLGTIVAGLFAQLVPDPTHLVFWVYLAALAPALATLAIVPETVADPSRPRLQLRRPTLPDRGRGRREFLSAAGAIFAGFAVNGLFSSLVPSYLREELGVENVAAIGAVVSLLFIAALLAQLAAPARWLSLHWLAPGLLITGMAVFQAGLWAASLPAFITGTVLAGTGVGLTFRRGIEVSQRLADPRRRADLLATFFIAAYAGLTVPTLAAGVLDQQIDRQVAAFVLAVSIGAITIAAALARPHDPTTRANRSR